MFVYQSNVHATNSVRKNGYLCKNYIFDLSDPIWPRNFFSSSNFCRDCQDVSCHQISWQYLATLMSWNFFCEKRFLTLFDLRWPLTPCWSRDIFGLAHCYLGPSLMKIGHKTWEIWTIKVLKERFSDFRKTTVQKQTIGDCIANGIRPRARAVFWAWFVGQNMTIIMINVDKYYEGNPLCFTNFNQCK